MEKQPVNKEVVGLIFTCISGILGLVFLFIEKLVDNNNRAIRIMSYVFLAFAAIALLVAVIYLIVRLIRDRKRVGTSSILQRSRKVTKDIKWVVKTAEWKIERYVSKHDTLDEERKELVKKTRKNILEIVKKNETKPEGEKVKYCDNVLKEINYFSKLQPLKVMLHIATQDPSQEEIIDLNNTILNSIKQTERALLVLEQYETRKYLGRYVLTHSSDPLFCADALIDYIGWTNALIGRRNEFVKAVESGIDYLKLFAKTDGDFYKNKAEVQLKLARAYRHLGSEVVFAKKNPAAAIEYNKTAMEQLECFSHLQSVEQIKKDYAADPDILEKNLKLFDRVSEMRVGIEYGILNAQLFDIKKNYTKVKDVDNARALLKCITDADKLIDQSQSFKNPHRYLKCILLENEFLKLLEPMMTKNVQKEFAPEIANLFGPQADIKKYLCERFDKNTEHADSEFKKAIYADEMMGIYIDQEAIQLFRIIKGIGK